MFTENDVIDVFYVCSITFWIFDKCVPEDFSSIPIKSASFTKIDRKLPFYTSCVLVRIQGGLILINMASRNWDCVECNVALGMRLGSDK